MIQAAGRYFGNAHRVSVYQVDPSVTTIHAGQWLSFNGVGNLVIATGATPAFITTSSLALEEGFAINQTIETPDVRDTVAQSGLAVILVGPWMLTTDQYDATQTYAPGQYLAVNGEGVITPWTASGSTPMTPEQIVGSCAVAPTAGNQLITIIHE